jgi:hypothetical protein
MDTAVQNAITAVSLQDDATAQRWFDTVCATYQALDQRDWDHFTPELTNQAASANIDSRTVDQFVRYLSDNDSSPLDTVGQLVDLGTELPALYQRLTATPTTQQASQPTQDAQSTQDSQSTSSTQADQAAASTGYDEGAWHSFLSQNGPFWNGDDAAWGQFRTWFQYQADQQGLTDPATGFLSFVEGQQDKRSAFEQYGVHIAAPATNATSANTSAGSGTAAAQTPDASTFPVTKPGDSGDWVDYLDAMLKSNGF